MIKEVRDINAILFTFNKLNHYNSTRVMDDFFIPKKHNFHPRDVIHDLELIGGEVFHFDNDLRDYYNPTPLNIGKDGINQSNGFRIIKK